MAEYEYHTGAMPMMPEQLPYNLEAEQSVLGALLIDPSTISTVMDYVKPDSFYRPQHRMIFSIIINMFATGGAIDFVTVLERIKQEGVFENEAAAKQYLTELLQVVPTTANAGAYSRIVQEKYYLRSLITAAREIIENSEDGGADAQNLLDLAEQRIFEIRQGREVKGMQRVDRIVLEAYDHLQKLSGSDREKYLGLPSGFADLDRVLTGLNKSDLILVAARPGMGKTAFALNIATSAARKSGKAVAVFSLEMSREQLVTRMLSSEATISSNMLRTGLLSPDDWTRLAISAQTTAKLPIYIDDSAGITVAEMKARLRRIPDLGLVAIDYLQLMTTGRKDGNRVQEVSEITRSLKIMAKELDVPVITLSQLSRGPEARADHRPMLSDLRESGSIEQDADIVLFLYRDAYYNEDTEEQNIAECIVAKNRHGETATIKMGWDGRYTRYTGLELFKHEG